MKILIADDDSVSAMVLAGTLRDQGHDVVVAADGKEALDLILQNHFPVVIADWVMPKMDGLELCRRIRDLSQPAYIYVILLTGRTETQDRIDGLTAGADDFLSKPFERTELIARLGVAKRIVTMESALRDANETIERTRRHEIEIGAHIQRALLMAQPPEEACAFTFAAMNIPSRQIDGDFFDFFAHGSHVVDLFIGDAMGKGVPAALIGAGAKSVLLRALTGLLRDGLHRNLPAPREIVQTAHNGLATEFIAIGSFVTLCYARLDAEQGVATFVDCGHTKTVHLNMQTGETELIRGGNFPIGFVETEIYEEVKVPFSAGDLFFFYSDGVTEATSPEGTLFGDERLLELLRLRRDESPSHILFRLREAIRDHTKRTTLDDDFTCVVVRVGIAPIGWTRIERTFRGDLEELTAIRQFVGSAALDCGLDGPHVEELQTAAHEATTNAIRHGLREFSNESISYVVERLSNGVRITLRFAGAPFIATRVQRPDIFAYRESGYGLFIIQEMLSHVTYGRTDDGLNTVTMTKLRH